VKTDDNLMAAFKGECNAYMKYIAYARAAENEGQGQIAKLFRAIAEAERIHALNHFAIMGGSSGTEQDLSSAIDSEAYEFTQMYPAFIQQADQDANSRAAASFRGASAVEKIHNALLSNALKSLGRNKEEDYYICTICGNTVAGELPDKCTVCGAASDKFRFVE
jgi:rubrerythrin